MSDFNQQHNRAVWFDIPVVDLDRANAFYAAVLGCRVDAVDAGGMRFSVLEHEQGNGGCLVPKPDEITGNQGILLYLNVEGRIRDATTKATELGGKVIEDVHSIAPHGFRAIVLDSEGNRVALHSMGEG